MHNHLPVRDATNFELYDERWLCRSLLTTAPHSRSMLECSPVVNKRIEQVALIYQVLDSWPNATIEAEIRVFWECGE